MLAFDHPFRNQGIDRGFRQAGRNAAPRSISRAIIDKRGPIGSDVGQKLLTKAIEPGGRQIALASRLVHIHDNLFERADRAFTSRTTNPLSIWKLSVGSFRLPSITSVTYCLGVICAKLGVARNASAGQQPLQPQPADNILASFIEQSADAPAAHERVHADSAPYNVLPSGLCVSNVPSPVISDHFAESA